LIQKDNLRGTPIVGRAATPAATKKKQDDIDSKGEISMLAAGGGATTGP
jgi:hypothetical protein